jgi:hypothetical protein
MRNAWLVLLLFGCAADGSSSPPDLNTQSTLPGRPGEAGEAGPPGQRGEKGDPGIIASTEVMANTPGALPLTANFTSQGGRLLVTVSGSGYRAAAGTIGMTVSIDGTPIGDVKSFTNEPSSHKAFVARQFVVQTVAAGTHAILLEPLAGTASDLNDYFTATILELR